MDLTNEQWAVIEPLIPMKRSDPRGKELIDPRSVLNGILWILRTGAQGQDLPSRYPSKSTRHRWHPKWSRDGVFEKILIALAENLLSRDGIDIKEAFIE